MLIQEQVEKIYEDYRSKDCEIRKLCKRIEDLSSQINNPKNISKDVGVKIEEYMENYHQLQGKMDKNIYKEGIKDCAKLLKLIGILK